MKPLSKPLSSPSRSAEKFPPPLMRFLRTNAGSRSRGRSRPSPIFYLRSKKRNPAGAIEATQEPSSPKVTCIGQVRVRRRKNAAANRRRCLWLKKALCFPCGFPKMPFRRTLSLLRTGCCREEEKIRADEKSEKTEINSDSNNIIGAISRNIDEDENGGDIGSRGCKREVLEPSSSSSPPRNALLLTRCRSAPYRSSSLGGRFWGSPLSEEIINGESENGEKNKPDEIEKPRCENGEDDDDSEEKKCGGEVNEKNIEDLNANIVTVDHPLLLTRCKSEPARRGERLIVVNPRLDVNS